MKFNNPSPVELDIAFEVKEDEPVVNNGLDLPDTEEVEIKEEKEEKEETIEDIIPVAKEEEKEEVVNDVGNIFLSAINELTTAGIIEEAYEGFDPDVEPNTEVLKKLLEHNLELRDRKTLGEFVESVSPLTQRIISYDLNKGENLEGFLRTIIEENNIKSLSVENEYDREKIVRMWYSDEDYTPEEIEEKIEELKASSLLEKEASRVKPKLDARAEAIAKQEEENQAALRKMELQREEQFFNKVEELVSTGKVGNINLSKETAQKVMTLLLLKDVKVRLPQGKEVKMNYLDAEIMRHKYSNQGDPALLIQAAYLLSDPEGFYKQFANAAKTEEVNKFTKEQKYLFATQSQPKVETKEKKKPQEEVKWRLKDPQGRW